MTGSEAKPGLSIDDQIKQGHLVERKKCTSLLSEPPGMVGAVCWWKPVWMFKVMAGVGGPQECWGGDPAPPIS